jgi:hypothetical protein
MAAWIALGTAGYLVFASQKNSSLQAAAIRAVDLRAREADDALAELRVGQQAYVASGQGVAFWMPKVAATVDAAVVAIKALRESASTAEAHAATDQASAALSEFVEVDKRARDYIRAAQTLMAADVIFTEGGQLATVATQQVEAARLAEHQEFDAAEAAMHKRQATILGAAAGIAGFVVLLLGATGGPTTSAVSTAEEAPRLNRLVSVSVEEGVVSHAKPVAGAPPAPPAPPPVTDRPAPPSPAAARSAAVLKGAADLATDFGRVRDSDELERLLARAAGLIEATGLIVWIANASGSELRPVLSHGYGEQALARMPSVPRSAGNAAAAAYRTGALQIVLSKPGGIAGAIVAPILGIDGCIGSLSAEIKAGGEASEAVQAVTTIVAAHLAGILAASPVDAGDAVPEARAAAQS